MHAQLCLFFPVFFAPIFLSLEWHPCCCMHHSYCSRPEMLLAALLLQASLLLFTSVMFLLSLKLL
jgi:hypothetical protein